MSEIRAVFEPGTWRDFSKQHAELRNVLENALEVYKRGKCPDALAVWGAYGAGKTQFLFWVAEKACEAGLVPVYFHLNDLLDGVAEGASPDEFRKRASQFVLEVVADLRREPMPERLVDVYRDKALLSFVQKGVAGQAESGKPILLIDEVEQAYRTLAQRVRADDRSPLRAWLEEDTFKVLAFAVGSLYVLGRADRERLRVQPIPPVHPRQARQLFENLAPGAVNGMWWMARGKPRHFMKAVKRYELSKPESNGEVYQLVSALDSVSQAPYEGESQSAVPAAYLDQLDPNQTGALLALCPRAGGAGKLIPVSSVCEEALLPILREAFKLETVAFDLARYVLMLADAVSDGRHFALTEPDTAYLLRMAVDFLLEYERERLEKDTVEGNAALRKLLEVHDRAAEKAGEVFWKLCGRVGEVQAGTAALPFEMLASAFPLPTTSPTIFGTDPASVRTKFDEQKQPVFEWTDSVRNQVLFLTSVAALYGYASSKQFRQLALSPVGGVLVLLPHDSEQWQLTGLLGWLSEHERLRVERLPLALTDFLLSLRAHSPEGGDPGAVAEIAEADRNLKRQVSFYRNRLDSYTAEMSCRPHLLVPSPVQGTLGDLDSRVADKDLLSLAVCQAFEAVSPVVLGYLADLRTMVTETRGVLDRTIAPGLVAVAEGTLPHRSARTGAPEAAKLVDDLRAGFSSYRDALAALASHVDAEDMEALSKDRAGVIALRALWKVKRGIGEDEVTDLNAVYRQLLDVMLVLANLGKLEPRLRGSGFEPGLGDLASLMEAREAIATVAKHTDELVKGRTAADKQLTRAIYCRFLRGFLGSVEAKVSKAKVIASKLSDALDGLASAQQRLAQVAASESVRFGEIEGAAVTKLTDALCREQVAAVPRGASLEAVLTALEGAEQSLSEAETRFAELSEAHGEIRDLIGAMIAGK